MGAPLLLVAMAIAGYGSWRWLWVRESASGRLTAGAGLCEHAAASTSCGLALWLAVNWLLALTHVLRPASIVAAALAVTALGMGALAWTRRRASEIAQPFPVLHGDIDRPSVVLLALIPLALWLAYAVTRGFVVPIVSPDANVYHLPKALLLLDSHGYARFAHPDFRVTSYPFNYELLLADVLAIDGNDRGTACISVAFFAIVLLAAAAQAERAWWGSPGGRAGGFVTVLLVAATPIGLLLSGEQKNDMLATSVAALAMTWLGRWVARGERLYGGLTIVCVAIGLGTKPSGAFVAVVAAPIFLFGLARSLRAASRPARDVAIHASVVLASFFFLGGVVILANVVATGSPFGIAADMQSDTGYGAWRNLLEFPYLLLTVPYSFSQNDVYVPWMHQRWWWMAYEMHTSHFGLLFTPFALAVVPLVVWDVRRGQPSPERTSRLVTLCASLGAAAAMVPMRLSPSQEGGFNCFPRYLFYVVPAVMAYGAPPLCRRLAQIGRTLVRGETAVVAAASLFFVGSAIRVAMADIYEPFQYAWQIFVSAGDELVLPLQSSDRVCFMIERVVGPRDKVLFDAGFDAWTYPALGSDWRRPVTLAPESGLAPIAVPDDVQWVAVDRAYRVIWGDPAFKTMGDAMRHFFRGEPSPEDLRTVTQLQADPRFRLVYRSFYSNQALFQRRPAGQTPEDDPPPIIVKGLARAR